MFQDQAGIGKLKTTAFQIAGSFHASLDKKSQNVLTLGFQWGKVQREVKDADAFLFGDYLEDKNNNPTNPMSLDPYAGGGSGSAELKKDYSDINVGLLFKSQVNKNTNYNIGFSIRHLTTPDHNFKASTVDLPMRITGHAQLTAPLTGKWSLTPELYYTNVDPASQFQAHAWAGYMLKPEKEVKLNFGLGYRTSDAAQVLLGLDYGSLKAALSYDVTLSELHDANNRHGGFEIAVYYIGKIYKKPEVKPVIIGPHL
jgi:type IX secretion system PorP/SprF family membrane protein